MIKYLHVFVALKTTWEEVNRLPDKELVELFCKEPELPVNHRIAPLHEFFKAEEKRLRQRGVTLMRLCQEYLAQHPDGFKMTAFYRHYNL